MIEWIGDGVCEYNCQTIDKIEANRYFVFMITSMEMLENSNNFFCCVMCEMHEMYVCVCFSETNNESVIIIGTLLHLLVQIMILK